jgi:RNA polymerase sigma-70 factor (ECF subfamily)
VAIAKRLTRARQRIQELRLPFEIPAGGEIGVRLEGVLRTIYLLFNEGYKASAGESLVREDLCREAIRLAGLLVEHPAGNQPQTHALLAVMLLNGARLSTRVDGEGNLLRLKEQDRSRWDQAMIARGMYHLDRSAAGMDLSPYHLQAGIAACHCAAKDYESTNWRQILRLYDQWVERDDSPVLALNRAVVVASLQGPAAGLAAIAGIPDKATLNDYYLLHSVMGHFKLELDDAEGAAVHFRRALELAETKSERALLAARLETCEARSRV